MSTEAAMLRELAAYERRQTAHHEAGHAVTAVWCGGTFLGISLEDGGWTQVDWTQDHALEAQHRDFVIFAGPWAAGRARWGERPLDGLDDHGLTLLDHVSNAMRVSHSDLRKYVLDRDIPAEIWDATIYGGEPPDIPLARDDAWYGNLESLWPAMQSVADMLLRDESFTPGYVRARLGLGDK